MAQVIVVGGGLSGLSAAHTVLERGGRVCLIDKNAFMGGNSTKATSGINGALTSTQIAQGIQDSPQAFYEDTAKSARDLLNKDLVKVLTYNSASAVEWLQEKFKLDLSLVSRLGGHSYPRTHRSKQAQFPGAAITFALMVRLLFTLNYCSYDLTNLYIIRNTLKTSSPNNPIVPVSSTALVSQNSFKTHPEKSLVSNTNKKVKKELSMVPLS